MSDDKLKKQFPKDKRVPTIDTPPKPNDPFGVPYTSVISVSKRAYNEQQARTRIRDLMQIRGNVVAVDSFFETATHWCQRILKID